MLQSAVVCSATVLPDVAWLTASMRSISPLVGQLAGLGLVVLVPYISLWFCLFIYFGDEERED